MDLYQIRYFLAVAETGSFTKAAERCFVSQPTLSAGIRKLEDQLDAKLFDRGPRQAVLTAAGSRLLPRARTIQHEMNAVRTDLTPERSAERLRLGLLQSLPIGTVAEAVQRFLDRRPDVRLEIAEGPPEQIERWFSQGRLDLAITASKRTAARRQRHLLFRDRQMVAVPAGHPLVRRPSLRVADMADRPLIVRTHCEHTAEARRILDNHGVRPRVVQRTTRDAWALAMVAAGVGCCLMPDSLAADGVTLLPVDGVDLRRSVNIEWVKGQADDLVEAFVDVAKKQTWRSGSAVSDRLEFAR